LADYGGGNLFSNIQAAQNAASAGGTLLMTGGTYTESVTTTKSLTMEFSGNGRWRMGARR